MLIKQHSLRRHKEECKMTDSTLVVDQATEYGAFELKRLYTRNFTLGMTIAVLIHLFLIGAYIFIQAINKDDENNIATVRILKYTELGRLHHWIIMQRNSLQFLLLLLRLPLVFLPLCPMQMLLKSRPLLHSRK